MQRHCERFDLRDARVKAAIVLSAPPFHGQAWPARILGPLRVPSLHVTPTEQFAAIVSRFTLSPKP